MSTRLYIYEVPNRDLRKMILTRGGRVVRYRDFKGAMDAFQEDVDTVLPFPDFTPLEYRRV